MSANNHSDDDEFFDTYDTEDQLRDQKAHPLKQNQFNSSSLQTKSGSLSGTPDKVDIKEKHFNLASDTKEEDFSESKVPNLLENETDTPNRRLDFQTIEGTSLVLKPKSEDGSSGEVAECVDTRRESDGMSVAGLIMRRNSSQVASDIKCRTDDSIDDSTNSSFASNNNSFFANPQLSMSASSFSNDRHMSDFCHSNGGEGEYFSTPSRKRQMEANGSSNKTSEFKSSTTSPMPEFYSQGHNRSGLHNRTVPSSVGKTSGSGDELYSVEKKFSDAKLDPEKAQISKAKESWLKTGVVEAEEKAQVKVKQMETHAALFQHLIC
mmetsp:Transcript_56718/g.64735  ORF Transcript_56718/g.64735 Transcript_56718/m.64735 type:complete len:322 (-) Transcript_56718:192-1157(-)